MSQQRPFQMMGGDFSDTTYTKIFVGGLAWETQRDAMRRYFEQFGEIQEAVVITDKNTGRSKGYGFVTFRDPDAATRACQNPSPVIDGRRANCNLASLGAQKTRPPQHGTGRFRPAPGLMAPPAYHGSSSTYVHQPTNQYTFPYSGYGYPGYSQDTLYPANYYGTYAGQQFSPYYTGSATSPIGIYPNFYPFYANYAQNSQAHGFGVNQYPQMLQYPYMPRQYSPTGILSLPSSTASATPTTGTDSTPMENRIRNPVRVTTASAPGGVGVGAAADASQANRSVSEQSSST
ncbi:hypothetical protein RHMOL_Rhmol01G0240700 [Rhododendron molle]|uniref:Uncharacterized protein n=1 Tax=Rhododendron molle TaxID=49168 RepID=A0ACC0Q4H4_RHOML|nr:hypothetical protein RHMOL_Rhmol01G0240700 [Rhododendron molle]